MLPNLVGLEQPIAIRPEFVVDQNTTFHVEQHGKAWSYGKFTISQPDQAIVGEKSQVSKSLDEISHHRTIMYVDGKYGSPDASRSFYDASGLPLFVLMRKTVGVTWYARLPGDNDTDIVCIAPRASIFKDKLDVIVKSPLAKGEETVLHVEGQDIWKLRINVYLGDKVVMTAKRTDKMSVYLPGKKIQWEVDIAAGMDMALASMIVVVMAANMYASSLQSSSSA